MHVNQRDLAGLFRVSVRTVRRWDSEEGLSIARVADAVGLTYDLSAAIAWRLEQAAADEDDELRNERIRLTKTQADRAELELRVSAGELIYAETMATQVADMLARLRSKVTAFKGGLAPRLTRLEDARAVKAVLDPAFDELLDALRMTADDLEGAAVE